jgi:hypothetical protein
VYRREGIQEYNYDGPLNSTTPLQVPRHTVGAKGLFCAMKTRYQVILIVVSLLCVSFFMTVVQFLASEYGGAGEIGVTYKESGNIRLGNALIAINKCGWLREIDHFWQQRINWPRNQLLYRMGKIASPDDIEIWTRGEWWGRWGRMRDAMTMTIGTVIIYAPPVVLIQLLWKRFRKRRDGFSR